MQAAPTTVCARLRVRALLPARRASEVRQRAQSLRRCQCQQNASRFVGASARRRGELHGVRSRRACARPCVWLRERHLVAAAANRRAPEPARRGQRRDRVHADAASSEHHHHHHRHRHRHGDGKLEILAAGNNAIVGAVHFVAASVTGASTVQQAGHESSGEGRSAVDLKHTLPLPIYTTTAQLRV